MTERDSIQKRIDTEKRTFRKKKRFLLAKKQDIERKEKKLEENKTKLLSYEEKQNTYMLDLTGLRSLSQEAERSLSENNIYLGQAGKRMDQYQADRMGNRLNVEIDNEMHIEEHEFHRLS